MKKILLFGWLLSIMPTQFLFSQQNEPGNNKEGIVRLNSDFSYQMLEPNQNLRKTDILLHARQDSVIKSRNLYIGVSLIVIADYQKSNTNSKFAYLMRHPTSSNEIGESVSEAVVHSAHIAIAAPINNWLTAYSEILYDPEQSFGAGTITALSRNQLQLRKGYILVGDLNKSPFSLAIGKMDAPFGQTSSVSPFSSSTMWHAFGGLGYGALIGFEKSGFNASFMLVQGGAQFRALNTPVESTSVPSRLNNFVADANYTFKLGSETQFKVGGSYVHGSAYCHSFPVVHFNPCEDNNPAYTFYGKLDIMNRITLKGGFAKTSEVWPGTFNPNPPLDVFEASKVSSLDIGGKYVFNPNEDVVYSLSAEFSNFVSGPDGSPWKRQNQIVVGFSSLIKNSSRLFVEFFNTKGYVPLNFLSGGNFEDPGVTHSVLDANSIGIVVGGLLAL